ncbi:MAG TPA: HAMP domain-containing sensor histidine kinase, partial [Candidatus Limnocylindrales bacterium]|nr:HAMP domain-containing sensor histidine kinase [Candidatus Limnocylindrales bacterium]
AALGTIIADLDDLASAEAAPLHAAPVSIDVGELVRGIAAALDGQARTAGATLVIEISPGLAAWADREHVRRALTNVVANGIRHGAGRPVEIRGGTSEEGEAVVRVTDHGPGIAAADLPHVFERFYRADRSRAADPATGQRSGSGLGLTIARELLAANGGGIDVEATGPAGTTFVVRLPRSVTHSQVGPT